MTILDKIIIHKKIEVEKSKTAIPIYKLEQADYFKRTCISLSNSLISGHKNGIIAEFKKQSPSKGVINANAIASEIVAGYEHAGVAAASILTDHQFFGGKLEDLYNTRSKVNIPLLRKDFIIDEYQILEAKANGADIILLIAACLEPKITKKLAYTARQLGLDVLLEMHEEIELDHLNEYITLAGINNRNLKTFVVDVENSLRMSDKIGHDFPKVAESGIANIEQYNLFRSAGFSGFLMGEYFMKHENPIEVCKNFINSLYP